MKKQKEDPDQKNYSLLLFLVFSFSTPLPGGVACNPMKNEKEQGSPTTPTCPQVEPGMTYMEHTFRADKPFTYDPCFTAYANSAATHRDRHGHQPRKVRKIVHRNIKCTATERKRIETLHLYKVSISNITSRNVTMMLRRVHYEFMVKNQQWYGPPPSKYIIFKRRCYQRVYATRVRCVIVPVCRTLNQFKEKKTMKDIHVHTNGSSDEEDKHHKTMGDETTVSSSAISTSTSATEMSTAATTMVRIKESERWLKLYGTRDIYHQFSPDGSAVVFGETKDENDSKCVVLYPRTNLLVFRGSAGGPSAFINKEGAIDVPLANRFVQQLIQFCTSPLDFLAKTGKIVGQCLVCGAALSDPHSQVMGMGPVCYKQWKDRTMMLFQHTPQGNTTVSPSSVSSSSSSTLEDVDDEIIHVEDDVPYNSEDDVLPSASSSDEEGKNSGGQTTTTTSDDKKKDDE